jgi:probable HAF family extracellular repeat protein
MKSILALPFCLALGALAACQDTQALPFAPEDAEMARAGAALGVVALGTLGGPSSFATDINNAGVVIGSTTTADGARRAFRWTARHGMEDITPLVGENGFAVAINNSGDITGTTWTSGEHPNVVVWSRDGQARHLPPAEPDDPWGWPTDINDAGDVIGYSGGWAVLWRADGSMELLHVNGIPLSINNAGVVVGEGGGYYNRLLRTPTGYDDEWPEWTAMMLWPRYDHLGDEERGYLLESRPVINNRGEIIGQGGRFHISDDFGISFAILEEYKPMLWRDGFQRYLPFVGVALNTRGDIVGSGKLLTRRGPRDVITDLGGSPVAINDSGDIVGSLAGSAVLWTAKRGMTRGAALAPSFSITADAASRTTTKPCPKPLQRIMEAKGWPECPAP